MNKFYNFISNEDKKHELYLTGAIVSSKWDESDVTFKDFRDTVENMEYNSTLDIFINSPGGEVFVCQSIISLLKRTKETKNITINATIDGLGASCASWLPMVADNIYIYQGSILMLHKPLIMTFGNANDMKKEIEVLDKIENSEMIPMYMSKAKEGVTEETIRDLLSKESWLDYNEIQQYFNVTLLEDNKKIVACVDNNLFKNYQNVPQELLNQTKEVEKLDNEEMEQTEIIEEDNDKIVETEDNDEVENDEDLENVKKKKKCSVEELEEKLDSANQTIIELNDKIEELQKIADKYNEEQEEKNKKQEEELLDEKKTYYKNKFESLGAKEKYESKEIQNLVNNCVKDKESLSKLNQMVVDMIQLENKNVKKDIIEPISKIENLIPEADGAEKYGFR